MQSSYFKKIKLPDRPGVYFFKRGKEILYIGKATSLKDRVKSYFGKDLIETRGLILVDMVFQAEKIDYQITDSVLEAIILEANLIKKYQPRYNTKEKSDKSFNFVCITKPARNALGIADAGGEKLPKVVLVRGHNLEHSQFKEVFGPFTNGAQLREALKIVRRIFPFLDDKNKNYLEFYRQINLAPDINDRKLYLQNIKNIKLFFEGKKKKILKNLQKEMKEYAKEREFERAGEVKRQIFALKHINDIALIKSHVFPPLLDKEGNEGRFLKDSPLPDPLLVKERGNFRIEAYDIAHMGGKNMTGVMVVVEDGEVNKNEYRKFKIRTQADANDTGALREVLQRRLVHAEWQYPSLIVVDGSLAQKNVAEAVLRGNGVNIPVVAVVKDERHKPKAISGNEKLIKEHKRAVLLANSEAHRFAIAYHKKMRDRNFIR